MGHNTTIVLAGAGWSAESSRGRGEKGLATTVSKLSAVFLRGAARVYVFCSRTPATDQAKNCMKDTTRSTVQNAATPPMP